MYCNGVVYGIYIHVPLLETSNFSRNVSYMSHQGSNGTNFATRYMFTSTDLIIPRRRCHDTFFNLELEKTLEESRVIYMYYNSAINLACGYGSNCQRDPVPCPWLNTDPSDGLSGFDYITLSSGIKWNKTRDATHWIVCLTTLLYIHRHCLRSAI